jgi:uncharacterized protein YdhG (YjbR/CyaY superfamily)
MLARVSPSASTWTERRANGCPRLEFHDRDETLADTEEQMKTEQAAPASIGEYIAGFPPDVRRALEEVRATIRETVPEAEETISYGIPTFRLDGTYLIYFAGYRAHLSLYPAPLGVPEFEAEMAVYGSGKGTAKLPLNRPMPLDLVRRIVQYRAGQNRERAASKGRTR